MTARPQSHLFTLAAKYRCRKIGLYGGSFNPVHVGHIHVAKAALRTLGIDEVWMMISPGNPLKDRSDLASFADRLAGVQRITNNHPHIHASTIEQDLGIHYSVDTLSQLTQGLPNTQFFWLIGADSLASFHQWRDWCKIAEMLPIAVFDRPLYDNASLKSPFARKLAKHRVAYQHLSEKTLPAWSFVRIPRHKASATKIRNDVKSERRSQNG